MVDPTNENDGLTPRDGEEDGEEGKGKKGKGDLGTMERGEVQVGEGFYATMFAFGASVNQIREILANWRHLRGQSLARALTDFARRMTRATPHIEVEIDRGKDFGLIHNFVQTLKSLRKSPEQKQTLENRNHPGQNGPTP